MRRARENEVNEREKAVARYKKEMKELREEHRKGREEREHFAGLLQRSSDEFGKMKQSLQKAEASALAKARKLEEEKTKLEEEVTQLREAREEQEEAAESADSLFRAKEQLLELEREKEFEMRKLLEENQRLNNEITRLLTENGECAGHSNPSQRIKHHMKIKEENNKLKAEVFQLQQEVCKLKDQIKHGREPVAKHNERKITEEKYARVKTDFEKKSKDLKTATNSISKIADYVLSRPHVPETIRKAEGEKSKLIMDAVQFLNRTL